MGWLDRLFGKARRSPSPLASGPPVARPVFAVVDVETTGLSPRADRVLELAVVRLDASGGVVDEWSTRFNPEGPVGATHIHGITDADVAAAPVFRDLSGSIASRLQSTVVVAHNARFDLGFLRAEYERSGWDLPFLPAFCTLEASDHYLPRLERRRLADCCAATGIRLDRAHSALGDARATAGLVHRYLTMPGVPVHPDLASLPASARALSWPNAPTRNPTSTLPVGRPRPQRVTPARPKQPPLAAQLAGLSLTELLDDGAPAGALSYLELLVEVLEDGVMTDAEASALNDLLSLYELGRDDVAHAHRAFITALAHRALDDGHVSRAERAELHALASLLDVPSATVQELVAHADGARAARLGADLQPLPTDWALGEPLRVGDKVVFTGCDDTQRARLEKRAESLGVRIMGNVSRQTSMLVTDGSFAGGKAAKAAELGTRIVHPDDFDVLLRHLQPATRPTGATPDHPRRVEHPVASAPRFMDEPEESGAAVTPVTSATRGTASPATIRAWAVANGFEVSVRGRLPRAVVDAFATAHGDAN